MTCHVNLIFYPHFYLDFNTNIDNIVRDGKVVDRNSDDYRHMCNVMNIESESTNWNAIYSLL